VRTAFPIQHTRGKRKQKSELQLRLFIFAWNNKYIRERKWERNTQLDGGLPPAPPGARARHVGRARHHVGPCLLSLPRDRAAARSSGAL
jgi:hypothetical protein